jgi:MFS family permease
MKLSSRPSYRWIVLGMGFFAVFGALGFGRFGYSAILPAMQEDLGISSAAAGSLASWNLGGYVAMAVIGGALASWFGPRKVVGIGSVIAATGMLLTGISHGLTAAAGARLLTGIGGGMVLVPSVALMSAWFGVRQRGMASGVVSSGSSLALVITGPVVPAIIAFGGAGGWRYAWFFFAGLTAVVGILVFIVQRDRPFREDLSEAATDAAWLSVSASDRTPTERGTEAATAKTLAAWSGVATRSVRTSFSLGSVIRSRYAWHMGFVYLAFGFAYIIYFTFFQKRLTADLDFSAGQAGALFMVVGVASLVCGVLWGAISDRIGRGRALALMCVVQAAAAALFAWWPTTPGLIISATAFGLTAIAFPGIVGAGCGDQYGPRLASVSLGFVTVFLGLGQVLGPYLAGRMADSLGSLKYAYVLAAGVFLMGAIAAGFLRETGWAAERHRRNRTTS